MAPRHLLKVHDDITLQICSRNDCRQGSWNIEQREIAAVIDARGHKAQWDEVNVKVSYRSLTLDCVDVHSEPKPKALRGLSEKWLDQPAQRFARSYRAARLASLREFACDCQIM